MIVKLGNLSDSKVELLLTSKERLLKGRHINMKCVNWTTRHFDSVSFRFSMAF